MWMAAMLYQHPPLLPNPCHLQLWAGHKEVSEGTTTYVCFDIYSSVFGVWSVCQYFNTKPNFIISWLFFMTAVGLNLNFHYSPFVCPASFFNSYLPSPSSMNSPSYLLSPNGAFALSLSAGGNLMLYAVGSNGALEADPYWTGLQDLANSDPEYIFGLVNVPMLSDPDYSYDLTWVIQVSVSLVD